MEVTAKSLLTSNFFNHFALLYHNDEEEEMYEFFDGFKSQLALYVAITYGDLAFWDDLTMVESSTMAYAVLGDTFKRLYDALMAEYNPLENYFVDRTMQTDTDGTVVKSGDKTTTPSGKISVKATGDKTRQFTSYGTEHKGTTFESTTPYVPISKDETGGTAKDSFTNYGTETTYENGYNVEEKYNDITDTTDMGESITEHRAGNSGIFRKQELTQAEINLRINNRIIPIVCRMLVDLFNKGVW